MFYCQRCEQILVKSGNGRSLRNVYIGAVAGIVASFVAARILSMLKSAWAGAGQSQEVINENFGK